MKIKMEGIRDLTQKSSDAIVADDAFSTFVKNRQSTNIEKNMDI